MPISTANYQRQILGGLTPPRYPPATLRFFACFHAGYYVPFTREKSRRRRLLDFPQVVHTFAVASTSKSLKTFHPWQQPPTPPHTAQTLGASSPVLSAKPPTKRSSRQASQAHPSPSASRRASLRRRPHPRRPA